MSYTLILIVKMCMVKTKDENRNQISVFFLFLAENKKENVKNN